MHEFVLSCAFTHKSYWEFYSIWFVDFTWKFWLTLNCMIFLEPSSGLFYFTRFWSTNWFMHLAWVSAWITVIVHTDNYFVFLLVVNITIGSYECIILITLYAWHYSHYFLRMKNILRGTDLPDSHGGDGGTGNRLIYASKSKIFDFIEVQPYYFEVCHRIVFETSRCAPKN